MSQAQLSYEIGTSALGPTLVVGSERGVSAVAIGEDCKAKVRSVASRLGAEIERDGSGLGDVFSQLEQYFAGQRRQFDIKLDLSLATPFQRRVLDSLRKVGFGQTTTYGALAAGLGQRGAARAVGQALNRNPLPIFIPCHRVVGSNGSLTGFAGGLELKRRLLALEQVTL